MSITNFFNKTFFKVVCLLLIITTVGVLFTGCGLSKFSDGPKDSDAVTGNGGLAVTKGDYLYFVNGYKGIEDIGDSNHFGKVEQSAVFRAKLTDGKVTENTKYDDEGEVIFDKTKSLKDVDILASKIAGYEYTKLYIFGDYLYYSTPNHLRDKSGTILSKYINIYRIRIDRSGSNDLIYSSASENTSVTWSMHQVGDKAYMTILDGEKLVVIANNTKSADFKQNVVAEKNITSASMPTYANSTDKVSEIDHKIYFTEKNDDDSTTVVLKSYDLKSNKTADVYTGTGVSYEIKGTCGDNLYYTKTQTGVNTKIYADDLINPAVMVSAQAYGSSADIRSYALSGQTAETSIFYSDGTNSYYKIAGKDAVKFLASDIISNIVKVQGNYIYYLNSSSLYCVDFTKAGQTGTSVIPSSVTPKGDIVNNFSVDGKKIYFFVKYTENYYMHYVNYEVSEYGDNPYTHFVGKLLEADYVTEE